jgi:hypothetical protein
MKTTFSSTRSLLMAAATVGLVSLCQNTEATGNLYQPNGNASPLIILPGSSIDFLGNANLNGPLLTATAFTNISGLQGFANPNSPVVQNPTGSYAGVAPGTSVAFNAFTFGPGNISTNFVLWTFTAGADTYAFNITSISTAFQTPVFLDVGGNGFATIDGVTAPATWSIVDTSQGSSAPVVTFSASFTTSTPVPEPSSLALMTVAVLGLGVYRHARKTAPVQKAQKC